jgi:hypothetical protein
LAEAVWRDLADTESLTHKSGQVGTDLNAENVR